jgi:hypothetical protein
MKITPKVLEKIVRMAWSKETCYPDLQDEWGDRNPALGQCAVTALIVQDYFGVDLLYCKHHKHYWNKLSDGSEVDFTYSQFLDGVVICLDEIRNREYILKSESAKKAKTPERYLILKTKTQELLNKYLKE